MQCRDPRLHEAILIRACPCPCLCFSQQALSIGGLRPSLLDMELKAACLHACMGTPSTRIKTCLTGHAEIRPNQDLLLLRKPELPIASLPPCFQASGPTPTSTTFPITVPALLLLSILGGTSALATCPNSTRPHSYNVRKVKTSLSSCLDKLHPIPDKSHSFLFSPSGNGQKP